MSELKISLHDTSKGDNTSSTLIMQVKKCSGCFAQQVSVCLPAEQRCPHWLHSRHHAGPPDRSHQAAVHGSHVVRIFILFLVHLADNRWVSLVPGSRLTDLVFSVFAVVRF